MKIDDIYIHTDTGKPVIITHLSGDFINYRYLDNDKVNRINPNLMYIKRAFEKKFRHAPGYGTPLWDTLNINISE
jgi:hypothetical protein